MVRLTKSFVSFAYRVQSRGLKVLWGPIGIKVIKKIKRILPRLVFALNFWAEKFFVESKFYEFNLCFSTRTIFSLYLRKTTIRICLIKKNFFEMRKKACTKLLLEMPAQQYYMK